MKLQDKKTGEVKAVQHNNILIHFSDGTTKCYHSIEELNEDFEDYEEPKEFWFIDADGEVEEATYLTEDDKSNLKNFGNYFETKEEAEEVVEKLKAWKRLKDAGFKFKYIENNHIEFGSGYIDDVEQFINDMALLFGGEE